MTRVGHWQRCEINYSHKNVNVMFFKKPSYPHNYCELCVYEIRKRNSDRPPLPGFHGFSRKLDSKPEKDTL